MEVWISDNSLQGEILLLGSFVLVRKTLFVSLVDLTNGWQKLDRSFVLLVFLFLGLFLDVYLDPFEKLNMQFLIFEIRIM